MVSRRSYYAEVMRWYRLAADQGHVKAQYNLALQVYPVQTPSKCPSKCPSKAGRPSASIMQLQICQFGRDAPKSAAWPYRPNLGAVRPIWVPFGQQGWWPGQLCHASTK